MCAIAHNTETASEVEAVRTELCRSKRLPDISRRTDDNPRNPQIMYSILSTGEKNGPLGKVDPGIITKYRIEAKGYFFFFNATAIAFSASGAINA